MISFSIFTKDREWIRVEGWPINEFFAYRALGESYKFNVTHLPTGFGLGPFRDRHTCIRVARRVTRDLPVAVLRMTDGKRFAKKVPARLKAWERKLVRRTHA